MGVSYAQYLTWPAEPRLLSPFLLPFISRSISAADTAAGRALDCFLGQPLRGGSSIASARSAFQTCQAKNKPPLAGAPSILLGGEVHLRFKTRITIYEQQFEPLTLVLERCRIVVIDCFGMFHAVVERAYVWVIHPTVTFPQHFRKRSREERLSPAPIEPSGTMFPEAKCACCPTHIRNSHESDYLDWLELNYRPDWRDDAASLCLKVVKTGFECVAQLMLPHRGSQIAPTERIAA